MVKEDSFVTILPFMVNELKLKGNELLVYAIIHGFTMHSDEAWYTGSAHYLAEWCGCSRNTIYSVLKKLTAKGLIRKRVRDANGVTFADYQTIHEAEKAVENTVENQSEPLPKNETPTTENCEGGTQKFDRGYQNFGQGGYQKTCHQNIELYMDSETKRKKDIKKRIPSLTEVSEYIKEKGYGLDAQEFIDTNEMRGWKQKNGRPIEDWRACVRVFERNRIKWEKERRDEKVKEQGGMPWEIENYIP